MTPPLTDTELLAYIERTPELSALFPDAAKWLSPHAAPYANFARAFHAAEQRVREEAAEAVGLLLRENEVLRHECLSARLRYENCVAVLNRIYALLNPEPVGNMRFVNPQANEVLDALSRRIRAIPAELAKQGGK